MTTDRLERAAVLGAGTMGGALAAHLANAGAEVWLLDLVSEGPHRSRLAQEGLERARRADPPSFFHPDCERRVHPGNFEDDLGRLAEVDWILEAVPEDLAIKQGLYEKVDGVRRPGTLVTTNTSGLSIHALAEGRSTDFRKHFLGTHFFNPPRYLHLLELVPHRDVDPSVVECVREIGDRRLGKGIVVAKDTPGFIANRIGTWAMMRTVHAMIEMDFTIEEVDSLTGTLIGRPRSATFRTADLVGLDVLVAVARHLHRSLPADEARDVLAVPDFLARLVERGSLGSKKGEGFYQKVGTGGGRSEILRLDWKSLEYEPGSKPAFASADKARAFEDVGKRLSFLVFSEDPAGRFLWRVLSETLVYAAHRIPEIADSPALVDQAMRWGFGWQLGPFEVWDALGPERVAGRLEREGRPVPDLVTALLKRGGRFYEAGKGRLQIFLPSGQYALVPQAEGVLLVEDRRRLAKVVEENEEASLIDLGEDVLLVEFHSKRNVIGSGTLDMLQKGITRTEASFKGMVIGSQGEQFSAGANIALLLFAARGKAFDEIEKMVRLFQRVTAAIRYSKRPVVVAPYDLTLGGGCELALHAPRLVAAAETYMGLVETAVGLLPAAGGTTEMTARALSDLPPDADPMPHLTKAFLDIATARVSRSAAEARTMGMIRACDRIVMNRDRLLAQARREVSNLHELDHRPPLRDRSILALGEGALANLRIRIHQMQRAGRISEYDAHVAETVARVLCGGELVRPRTMPESHFLDLEREAFLHLCGQEKTLQRIEHMLAKGKPLRN